MTHGDKKKGKASKASGKKAIPAAKTSKTGSSTKGKAKVTSRSKASPKTSKSETGNGPSRRSGADVSFTNPAVGSAFRDAVKKFPNAFRKLTD